MKLTKSAIKKYLAVLLLFLSQSLNSQNSNPDIRNFTKLKYLIEGESKYPIGLLSRDEAILFTGYFGDSTHSEYLCNLLKLQKFNENHKAIIRALGMLRSEASVQCLISYLNEERKIFEKWKAIDSLIFSVRGSSREKYTIAELEKNLVESKGEVRENFRQLLIGLTNDKMGKYVSGIDFSAIDELLSSKDMLSEYSAFTLFLMRIKSNEYEDALSYADRIIERNEKLWVGHMLRGYCLFLMNRYDNALPSFKKSLKLNQIDSDSYFYIGDIYKYKNESVMAKNYYEEGIKYTKSIVNKTIAQEKISEIAGTLKK